ncbi:hypothetical protein BDN72DRAFT_959887 [Pluteus cervinus]|uniref:Uncharacterized protein n=1 Tax=Pluteus cervinus TaxID=181527 RepID=A0ACD3AT04_9AGAR|nr:hypothetical protein BDN72DRAFT_959887 [Pluteus cervinus]
MGGLLDLLDIEVPPGAEGQLQDLIIGAQKGSIEELSILARIHGSLPDPLTGEIHLIFLNHLNSSDVPTKPKSNTTGLEEKRAFWSLWALAALDSILSKSESTRNSDPCGTELVKAWPGVFKWSAYFYTFRVQDSGDHSAAALRQRSIVREVLICAWCALFRSKSAKGAMFRTRGIGDIAARLWFWEFEADAEVTRITRFSDGVSTMPCLQDLIGSRGNQAAFDSLISAAGGDIGRVMQTTCHRLKKIVKAPRFTGEPVYGFLTFMFMAQLCLSKPEAHQALLSHGAIPVCIEFLFWIAFVVNEESYTTEERDLFVDLMKVPFALIGRSIETTTGLPWVLEAINSGLLAAFVECSPLYDDLPDDEYATVSSVITTTIPKYLVYSCAVQAMDKAFLKLKKTAQFRSLQKTRAWEGFYNLAVLTSWRVGVAGQFKQMQKEITTCDSPKCYKSDARNKFRKCAKCGWALYCSKECQTVHWKEFGHKKVCREPGGAYNGSQEDGNITIRDWEYIQSLNICETRYNLPYLKRLASTEYPGVPLDKLSIVIDYTTVPTSYHVTLRSRWMKEGSKAMTCGDHCIHEAVEKPGTNILGLVPHSIAGPRIYHTPTPFEDRIWDLDQVLTMMDGTQARLDPTGNKIIDWMSEAAEERTKLYCGI